MALSSAAALVTATTLLLAAAAAPPAPIGLPGCNTTCGNVSVPYPFGFGPSRCYREGFNLTCDTSHGSPRLLLGDGSLRVVDIFIQNATVRVLRDGSMIKVADNVTTAGLSLTFAPMFAGGHYRMSFPRNELVLFGCDSLATVVAGNIRGDSTDDSMVIGSCVSFCATLPVFDGGGHYCSNGLGCCQVSFPGFYGSKMLRMFTELHLSLLGSRSAFLRQREPDSFVSVFLAEEGWLDKEGKDGMKNGIPLILRWDIMKGLPESDEYSHTKNNMKKLDPDEGDCPLNVASLCISNYSLCSDDYDHINMCQCEVGYDGNPYVAGGCQDIDECKHPQHYGCFGECTNTEGSFECRCQSGTIGDATIGDGCFKTANSSSTDALRLAGMPPVPIGRPNCNTTCGDVHVPYPFGFGPSGCYLPGFNLTCDARHKPPRLLLGGGNSTFQVDAIFLNSFTVRVIHDTNFDFTNVTYDTIGKFEFYAGIRFPDIRRPYMLSTRNEFIVTGCNVEATLHGEYSNTTGTYDGIISSCVSNCTSDTIGIEPISHTDNEYCSGRDGCCHAPIPPGSKPKKVKFRELIPYYFTKALPPLAFVAEEGQIDQWYMIFNRSNAYYFTDGPMTRLEYIYRASQVPIILRWVVKQHVPTSAQSDCQRKNGSYICYCKEGFYGNPYIIGGCHDIDECKIPSISGACFGECKNLDGSYTCQCPRGTRGNPHKFGGCVKILTGLNIGLLSASGPSLLLLILGINFALRKVKQHRIKLQKQKYFKQNRGQLLQQLVSQRADIAERMVVPLEELEKATNNFDQSRKLGGGGHGTVYKGILSDLHIVAIKKSKVEVHRVQREIDDFIHEVSILSQINHRNVVKLLGCCLETQVPLLVYEFISNGTLHSHLHKKNTTGSLPWKDRLRIASETAKAIAYLHSSVSIPIIHRDIKSANILLDDALTAKVSDFGASRYIPEDQNEAAMTAIQGTPGYLDPIYCSTGQMTEMSDVYSFGVVLMELLTRKAPNSFQEGNGLVGEFNALLTEGNLAQILDPQVVAEGGTEVEEVAALAASCTKSRGEERPTMRQVEMALEAFQKAKDPGLENVVMRNSEGNIARNHLLTRRRTDTVEGSRQYSLEKEFLMSASFPR